MSIERISKAVLASSPLASTALADRVGILEHVLVILGRADGVDDAFADAGDDRFLRLLRRPGSLMFVRTVTRAFTLSWMPSWRRRRWSAAPIGGFGHVDDLWVHAGLHGIENVAAGQVDRGGRLPGQIDIGLVGGDHRVDHALHIPAGKNVRFHFRRTDAKSRAMRLDARVNDDERAHVSHPHAKQIDQAGVRTADGGPDIQLEKLPDHREQNEKDNDDDDEDGDKHWILHDETPSDPDETQPMCE